jgi:hypothetical protein
VHDHDEMLSSTMMSSLDKIRGEYEGLVEFIVADMKADAGQAFANRYQAKGANMLWFAPDGTLLMTLRGLPELENLKALMNQSFKVTPPPKQE